MEYWRKYATGTGADIIIPIVKADAVDFALSGDWTPASGDVKISKDGAAAANIATLPTFITSIGWKFVLSDTELTAKLISINIVDSAAKAIEDQHFSILTFGHASAFFKLDPTNQIRGGMTGIPNAIAAAAGGLFTRGTGAGQINQDADGRIDVNVVAINELSAAADVLAQLHAGLPSFTISAGGSTTEIRTNRTEADNHWTDASGSAVLLITTGTDGNNGIVRKATNYANTNGAFTVAAMPNSATDGTGIIIGRIEP